jgi:hypothetical protein
MITGDFYHVIKLRQKPANVHTANFKKQTHSATCWWGSVCERRLKPWTLSPTEVHNEFDCFTWIPARCPWHDAVWNANNSVIQLNDRRGPNAQFTQTIAYWNWGRQGREGESGRSFKMVAIEDGEYSLGQLRCMLITVKCNLWYLGNVTLLKTDLRFKSW